MRPTRRHWLRAALLGPAGFSLQAARKEFWESKDPSAWTPEEKQSLLGESPWAREGTVRMETDKDRPPASRDPNTRPPDGRQLSPTGGMSSVPIGGEPPPRAPKPDMEPVEFRVLARWETAPPVRLAGGPEVPELTGQFYVIRVLGLPLMPPPNPNQTILRAIKAGSRLERKGKPEIPCDHLFTGSGPAATQVLLFFPRTPDPITLSDRLVSLESSFPPFRLSLKFPLKDMLYKGQLAL